MGFKLNSADEKNLRRVFRELEAFPEHQEEILEDFAIDAVERAQNAAPVDTGNLRRNIKFQPIPDGVEVVSDAPYSGYVEYGTTRQREQPFFFPAIRKGIQEVRNRITALFKSIAK